MATVRIGISGWRYPPWRGVFYPKGLPQRAELEYAARQFPTIELNGSFYSLQTPASYQSWYEATPDAFVFSVKGPRFITHIKRLREVEAPLGNFFASGVLRLEEKLGPFLWQLPPNFAYDPARLEAFFKRLPRLSGEASALAKKHDGKLKTRAWTRVREDRPLRHAIEVRNASFETPEFVQLLREHRIACVVADTAQRWPLIEDMTADFVYARLHGDEELYASGYTPEALDRWAGKMRRWTDGGQSKLARLLTPAPRKKSPARDLFVYFDNDVKVHAPYDASSLAHRLDVVAEPLREPPGLEKATRVPRTDWPGFRRR